MPNAYQSKKIHWLWDAFIAFQRNHGLPTAEAIAKLQEVYPDEPVDAIVRAEGDLSRTVAQLASAPLPSLESMGIGQQPGQTPGPQQASQSPGTAQPTQQSPGPPQQNGQAPPDSQDMNALIRQRAGLGTSEQTGNLSHEAIMNAGKGLAKAAGLTPEQVKAASEAGVYDPANDPFRARLKQRS